MFINPQSEYYSVSKLNNIFNTTQGEGISLFHCNIRSLTKNLTPSNGVLCSLDSTPDIVATVKPVLSGHPLLSGQQPKSPNLFPLFTLNETFIKRTRTPKKYLKWSFLLLPTCIKRTLVIKFHHPTCQTPEMRKIASNCHPQIFRFLH